MTTCVGGAVVTPWIPKFAKKAQDWTYCAGGCGAETSHPSGYCEYCAPAPQSKPPERTGRYLKRGDCVRLTDPYSFEIFNDLIREIERLQDQVIKLNGNRCAECGELCMSDDYLCQECRG